MTLYSKLQEGNSIVLWGLENLNLKGKNTWELTLFGSKSDKMKFDPYLKLRVEGYSIALWGNKNLNFLAKISWTWYFLEFWELIGWNEIWPLLSTYLKLQLEENSIALWEFLGKNTWELSLFGSKSDKIKFDPYWPLIWSYKSCARTQTYEQHIKILH